MVEPLTVKIGRKGYMGAGDRFKFYSYSSDDGTDYAIKLTTVVAAQGGFTTEVSPRTTKVWGYGPSNIRHVYGVNSSGNRTRLPCQSNSFSLYVSGGSFTTAGGTYTVEGAIGEKRKLNSIA
jgi:hypothetical protein